MPAVGQPVLARSVDADFPAGSLRVLFPVAGGTGNTYREQHSYDESMGYRICSRCSRCSRCFSRASHRSVAKAAREFDRMAPTPCRFTPPATPPTQERHEDPHGYTISTFCIGK